MLNPNHPELLPEGSSAFLKCFDRNPDDLTQYGVFADLLEETHGFDEPALVYALRWMHQRGHRPHRRLTYPPTFGSPPRKVPAKFSWAWYRGSYSNPADHWYACLPKAVIPPCQDNRILYPSVLHAICDLAKWLEDIRIGYSLEGK